MAIAGRQHELAVFAFDLLHHNGEDLCTVPLLERRLQLTQLVARSGVRCLHLVQTFADGAKLLAAAERHGLEGIVSKRLTSSGTVPRLGEDQNCRLARCEPGAVAAVREALG